MEEFFIVQKRPCAEPAKGFYFRILNTRTGVPLMVSFLNQSNAAEQCSRLNDVAHLHSNGCTITLGQ